MEDKTKAATPEPAPAPAPAATPAPAPIVNVTIQQQDRAVDAAKAMTEGKELAMDVASQPGHVYLVNGRTVNANNEKVGSDLSRSSV